MLYVYEYLKGNHVKQLGALWEKKISPELILIYSENLSISKNRYIKICSHMLGEKIGIKFQIVFQLIHLRTFKE